MTSSFILLLSSPCLCWRFPLSLINNNNLFILFELLCYLLDPIQQEEIYCCEKCDTPFTVISQNYNKLSKLQGFILFLNKTWSVIAVII